MMLSRLMLSKPALSKPLQVVAIVSLLVLAQIPFSLAKWTAEANAPNEIGDYDILIEAAYNNKIATLPLKLIVEDVDYTTGALEVEPIYPMPREPPMRLKYRISLNGSEDFTVVQDWVSVFYTSEDTPLMSKDMVLEKGEDGYWYVSINPPLKGDYKVVISLVVEKDGKKYGGNFVSHFTSEQASPDLKMDASVEKRVLKTGEGFDVYLHPVFEGTELASLDIMKANVFGMTQGLLWDSDEHRYKGTFYAPSTEGIFYVGVFMEGQDFVSRIPIYVADLSRPKAARCPLLFEELGSCSDMRDARKCVMDYKGGNPLITEDELVNCIEGCGDAIVYGEVNCEKGRRGDLDGDGYLDIDDVETLQNIILPLEDVAKKEFVKCADYNLDGDVDDKDLQCLGNVVAGKWYGDFNGGICFDADYDAAFKGDLDGDYFITKDDSAILDDIIKAGSDGISMPEQILNAVDFNQDGRVDKNDKTCLNQFMGMDFDQPGTLLAPGQTIPSSCLKIYHLDNCQGIPGDINGDFVIDDLDLVLINLIDKKQISGSDYVRGCADVNRDNIISDYDVQCIASYLQGDLGSYYICLGCDEYTPEAYRHPYEICEDGYDNDCDGLVDKTDVDGVDYCQCGEDTPCWFMWDGDRGTKPGINDMNIEVCRKVSWDPALTLPDIGIDMGERDELEYNLFHVRELNCESRKECETMECDNQIRTCAFDGMSWDWYNQSEELPYESDDPTDFPKTCEDGYDNDCSDGDRSCKKAKWYSQFTSWEFWAGLVVAALVWFACPPCAAFILEHAVAVTVTTVVVSQAASMVDPRLGAFMVGFSAGINFANAVSYGSYGLNLLEFA